MLLRILLFTFAALLCTSAQAQFGYPPELPGSQSEVYKTVDSIDLKLWLYTPEGHNPETDTRPAIVFFFGGGWKSGSPAQFESQCRYLASRGMVAVTADYRVASRHGVKAVDCVEDAKSAVRWLRQNAKRLGIDPDRIAAGGGSAGGHTACCTALIPEFDAASEDAQVSSVPNALALYNPAVQLAKLDGFDGVEFSDKKLADISSRTGVPSEQISPVHHVREGLPPTILFHGMADSTVPFATVAEFARRSIAAGNRCDLKGYAEAPHGFFNLRKTNNAEQADRSRQWHNRSLLQLDHFFQSLNWLQGAPLVQVVDEDFVTLRGSLQNSLHKFATEKHGHVVFLGGSITEMNGYRPRVADWLQQQFADTGFLFTNAGIASTCSNTGAFRLQRDVISQGPVDLLFVEFAVNDDQDAGHSAQGCVQGMEGIIRAVRRHNPQADIVMVHFVNPQMVETLSAGGTVLSASQHERVARHYNVSSVDLSKTVATRIATEQLTWEQYGGTHPGPTGNQLAADLAVSVLWAGWKRLQPEHITAAPHPLPEQPLLETSFDAGQLLPPESAKRDSGWQLSEPDWQNIAGSKRARFTGFPLLHTTEPGATLQQSFFGTAVGAFVVAGPDAGQLQVQIDGKGWQTVELFHHYSKGLHYPRTVMFATDLEPAKHTVVVRLAETCHADSQGPAARILHLVVNGNDNQDAPQ